MNGSMNLAQRRRGAEDCQQWMRFEERTGSAEEVAGLVRTLEDRGWLTRRELADLLGWTERKIRAVAEAAGAKVVRGPRGFASVNRAGLDDVLHCARIAESQGRKMIDYAAALRRRCHGMVG